MISRNALTSIALALGLGILPAAAQATPEAPAAKGMERPFRPGAMGPRPGMAMLEKRFAAVVHLTDAQKASIKEIRAKHQPVIQQKVKASMDARKAFADAARKPETSKTDLKALHQTAADLAFEMRMERRAMKLEIRALLSPEQRELAAKFEGRVEGMMAARGGRGGRRGMGGRPGADADR
jgi:Spy/CpxP family protein refolding chaperone